MSPSQQFPRAELRYRLHFTPGLEFEFHRLLVSVLCVWRDLLRNVPRPERIGASLCQNEVTSTRTRRGRCCFLCQRDRPVQAQWRRSHDSQVLPTSSRSNTLLVRMGSRCSMQQGRSHRAKRALAPRVCRSTLKSVQSLEIPKVCRVSSPGPEISWLPATRYFRRVISPSKHPTACLGSSSLEKGSHFGSEDDGARNLRAMLYNTQNARRIQSLIGRSSRSVSRKVWARGNPS